METSEKNKKGKFGIYGGQYVAETLMGALNELEAEFNRAMADASFAEEYARLLREYVGRPSPLYFAERLTKHCGGARIFLKREDLNHTGAHKVNNTIGQALLARRMGKKRLIAETGAGMHGVDRDGCRSLWHGVRRFHGRRGRPQAGAERRPNEDAWR